MSPFKKLVYAVDNKGIDTRKVIVVIDYKNLHKFILDTTGRELAGLSEDCYYPKVSNIYKDLLHLCNANEDDLITYSKNKFKNPKWRLLHDPYTVLLVLIMQEFLSKNDQPAALSAMNLLSLRFYANRMYKYIRYCNPEYFRGALNKLSYNHIFNTKKTIGSSILHFSSSIFNIYKNDIKKNNTNRIIEMIYALRTRVAQSARSFAEKYYEIHKTGIGGVSKEKEDYQDQSQEKKIREIASKLSKDICVFNNIDELSKKEAVDLSKIGREYGRLYVEALSKPKYAERVETAYVLFLKEFIKSQKLSKLDFILASKAAMSVKISKKPIYYKKIIANIHDSIIKEHNLTKTFNNWSIQTQAASRSFISYYLILYMFNSYFSH